jgi:hypothetical protein
MTPSHESIYVGKNFIEADIVQEIPPEDKFTLDY